MLFRTPAWVYGLCRHKRRLKRGDMRITRQVVVLDAADLAAVTTFWAGVLGGHVVEDDDWHSVVDAEGAWRMGVQHAPDHVAPDWPGGAPGQQVHLDLWVEDIDAAHAEVMALGARVLQEAEESTEPDRFCVYADPAGHPFCLCWVVSC